MQEINEDPVTFLEAVWQPDLEIYGLEDFGTKSVMKKMSGVRIRKNKTIEYNTMYVRPFISHSASWKSIETTHRNVMLLRSFIREGQAVLATRFPSYDSCTIIITCKYFSGWRWNFPAGWFLMIILLIEIDASFRSEAVSNVTSRILPCTFKIITPNFQLQTRVLHFNRNVSKL